MAEVNFHFDVLDMTEREDLRFCLAEFFKELGGGPCGVRFQDECPDCGCRSIILTTVSGRKDPIRTCANKQCISNRP